MTLQEMDLDSWLESTQLRRLELEEYARSPLPIDSAERYPDLDTLIRAEDDAGRLLADSETYLAQAQANAVLAMKERYPELSAKERETMGRDSIRDIQRLVDGMKITSRTLSNRRFLMMNVNRSRI